MTKSIFKYIDNIEPFKNSSPDCNTSTTDSWWQSQKPYWEPQVNRIATHFSRPSLWGPDDQASDFWCPQNEHPRLKNNFATSDSIYFYIYFHDLQQNDEWDITVKRPDGTDWYTTSGTHSGANTPYTYYYYSRKLPSNAASGAWTALVNYRNVSYRHYFTVNCESNYTLTTQTGSYARIASDYIESSAATSNGNEVRLQAANSITLKPGFNAVAGSVFKARIRDCNYAD